MIFTDRLHTPPPDLEAAHWHIPGKYARPLHRQGRSKAANLLPAVRGTVKRETSKRPARLFDGGRFRIIRGVKSPRQQGAGRYGHNSLERLTDKCKTVSGIAQSRDLQQPAVCRGHLPLVFLPNARSAWSCENENRFSHDSAKNAGCSTVSLARSDADFQPPGRCFRSSGRPNSGRFV